jgi:hypothetical protein
MSILTNKMPNLTENAKVLILSKLEEGWSIRRVAQDYNMAKSTVQRIKQTILWCSKISATFYVVQSYLTYIKNMTLKFQKGIFTYGKNCNKSTS